MKIQALNNLEPRKYTLEINNRELLHTEKSHPDVICKQFLVEGHGMCFFGNKVGWVDQDGDPIKDSNLRKSLLQRYSQQDLNSDQLKVDVKSMEQSLRSFIEDNKLMLHYMPSSDFINQGTFYILDSESKITERMVPGEDCYELLAKVVMGVKLAHPSGINWYINLVVDVDEEIESQ